VTTRRPQKAKGKKRPRSWHRSRHHTKDQQLADQLEQWPTGLNAGGDPTQGASTTPRRTGGTNRGDAL
jgi:hypothetical protein